MAGCEKFYGSSLKVGDSEPKRRVIKSTCLAKKGKMWKMQKILQLMHRILQNQLKRIYKKKCTWSKKSWESCDKSLKIH